MKDERKKRDERAKQDKDSSTALYPIYLHANENGAVDGFAPGVTGLTFTGEDIESCIRDAGNTFHTHFAMLAENGQSIPKATRVEQHLTDDVCKDGFWFMIEVDASHYSKKVSKSITAKATYNVTIDTSDIATVCQDLADDPIIAKNYMLRLALTRAITEQIKRCEMTNNDAARVLDISHTAVSVLQNGNLGRFELDDLVNISHRLGFKICLDLAV
ncbi:type II toxin-antitoxin system HicB family antitoxin [Spartinivicinus ruber]|uniref:type II toxin-antitoxin system HicB family antitoxin n=1 Tax=Spartinivicinus ruber TaxID=2683272 RepID=UPI001CA41FEA|nr:type II toxin-antitoxin system HicB family antitoxin [Spartinivicinus ruber]